MNRIHSVFFIVLFSSTLFAGTTGKLSGRVLSLSDNQPIIGANIILEGTSLGAATDADGYYLVNNIPPGLYTVTVSAIGYQKQQFLKVKINVDFTTKLDVKLSDETLSLDAIIVEAKAPLIREDLTSSQTTIDAQQIESLPVESVGQLLTLQAGVTTGVGGDIHIRGGRSNEIAYTVNGVSIANPFDNSTTIEIATNAIQELSVISGTFNAEYGNAMSGIVNTVTKEGTANLSGEVSFYTGDYFSQRSNIFPNIKNFDPLNTIVSELSIGGPIIPEYSPLGFFISIRREWDKGYYYGIRNHNPWDGLFINKDNPNDIRVYSTGDRKLVPMNPSRELSATGKLTFKPGSGMKINYDVLYSDSYNQYYSHDFKYNPDGRLHYYEDGILNSIEFRHALDAKTFYTIKTSYNTHNYKSYTYPLLDKSGNPVDFRPGMDYTTLVADPRYQPTEKLNVAASYSFLYGGTSMGHYYENSETITGKFDITSQLDRNHEVKFGLEGTINTLRYQGFTILRDTIRYLTALIPDKSTPYHNSYDKYPFGFSAYIQDKMEFENLILNIGVRYDYFDAKSKHSVNTFYPSPNDPDVPSYIDKASLLKEAEAKHQLSPRLGFSFPITDRGIIHFSYGHFFQMPPFSYLYANSDFKYSYASGSVLYGNSDLNPEKTVTYELGLQQQLTDNLAFNVTGFFKDVRDLLAVQNIRVSGDKTYLKYVNKDYGSIKGLTFTLTKRRTQQDLLGVTLDYTYQVSEGNDTDADAFFIDLASGRQSEKIVVYLPWDQTHTLNGTVTVGESGNWYVSFIGKLGTGLPYTPQILEKQILVKTNSGRRPSVATVDFMAEKTFDLMDLKISVFVKVFNLFDALNERVVYFDTGRSTYSLLLGSGATKGAEEIAKNVPGYYPPEDYFNRPDYFYPPRQVRLGVSVDF